MIWLYVVHGDYCMNDWLLFCSWLYSHTSIISTVESWNMPRIGDSFQTFRPQSQHSSSIWCTNRASSVKQHHQSPSLHYYNIHSILSNGGRRPLISVCPPVHWWYTKSDQQIVDSAAGTQYLVWRLELYHSPVYIGVCVRVDTQSITWILSGHFQQDEEVAGPGHRHFLKGTVTAIDSWVVITQWAQPSPFALRFPSCFSYSKAIPTHCAFRAEDWKK